MFPGVYSGRGYFAFKPGNFPPKAYIPTPRNESSSSSSGSSDSDEEGSEEDSEDDSDEDVSDEEQEEEEEEEEEKLYTLDELAAQIDQTHLLELEAQERRKGEEEWIRHGGVLRDKYGRRDMARTQAIRDELALRQKEQRIVERWGAYQSQWDSLLQLSETQLGFNDFPWPVVILDEGTPKRPITSEDLECIPRIQEFFLEGLSVRGSITCRKARIRSSLTRWHPDKLGRLMARIRDEDKYQVQSGINQVVMALHGLMNKTV